MLAMTVRVKKLTWWRCSQDIRVGMYPGLPACTVDLVSVASFVMRMGLRWRYQCGSAKYCEDTPSSGWRLTGTWRRVYRWPSGAMRCTRARLAWSEPRRCGCLAAPSACSAVPDLFSGLSTTKVNGNYGTVN